MWFIAVNAERGHSISCKQSTHIYDCCLERGAAEEPVEKPSKPP